MKAIRHYLSVSVICSVAVVGCTITNAEQRGERTTSVPLSHPFAKRVASDHHDTCRAMASFGIDYPVLVQRALDGQPGAIRLMLSLPWIARIDGAVAESYAATRYKIVVKVGDDKLVAALMPCKQGINYSGIRSSLLGFPNPGADVDSAEKELKKLLPKFWQLLSDRIAQTGDQQTAGPELDREGLLRIDSGDLTKWAALHGTDIPELIEGCLDDVNPRRQLNSWKRLVLFLHRHGADGAAGEELSSIGTDLAANIDDERLLRIVAAIPSDQWPNLPFGLSWRFKYEKLRVEDRRRLQKNHPIAVQAIERQIFRRKNPGHQAEGANDQRPARAESKAE